ncbi:MAG TPA: gliding motility-associated ABC transporter substrate-binding protein GldG [Chitinophagaceae bacterium]|nr:gliding motility-associated ABC transporter substrate-binding protein GldG [Chitinophagaceae bacterium]
MASIFKRAGRWWWIPVILILLLVNFLAAQFHKRIDLTNEKRFTISSPVKKLLSNLDDVVQVDVFLKGELPSAFKGLASYTEDLLREFKEIGKNKVQYNFINPSEQIAETERTYLDTLLSLGISGINLTVQVKEGEVSNYIYPAAIVHYRDRQLPVILFEGNKSNLGYKEFHEEMNSAQALMEYKFANAIEQLTLTNRPMVAYSYGNGEPLPPIVDSNNNIINGIETFDLFNSVLRRKYNVFTLNINTVPVIHDTFKLLIIVKPSIPFTDDEKIKIDQFIMRGGKVIWFLDRLNAESDSLRLKNEVIAYDRNLNLEDLLFKYGVRINPSLLMDLQSDYLPFNVNGKDQFQLLKWNYYPLFSSRSNHLINKNIGLVEGKFVNPIDTVKSENVIKTILLSSSSNSRIISTPALISPNESKTKEEDELFKKKDVAVAVLLEGKFTSLYANRMSQSLIDSLASYGTPFQKNSIVDNKMILIADGDMVLNEVLKGEPLPMGVNAYTMGSQRQYPLANRDFLQNCLDYLINNSGLTEAKSKDYTLRLLDPQKVQDERTLWQLINIVLPVILIFIFGFIYQFWRRKKYSV